MGLGIGFSRGSDEGYEPVKGNPVPTNFKIVKLESYGKGDMNVVAVIRYPDAISYEGLKVLVFQGVSVHEIIRAEKIDPHFQRTGLAPFARFEPTMEGIHAARLLAANIPPTRGNREPLTVCDECQQIKRVISAGNPLCFDCATGGHK